MTALPLATRASSPTGHPSTEIDTGPTVSGTTFLAVLGGATLLFGVLAASRLIPFLVGSVALGLLLAALVVVRPHTPVPQLVLFLGGASLLAADTTFDPVIFVLLPLAHVILRCSWWAARVPRQGGVERSVLLLDLRRAAVVQGVCQMLALVGLAATALDGSGFLMVVGTLALGGLVGMVVPRTWWR